MRKVIAINPGKTMASRQEMVSARKDGQYIPAVDMTNTAEISPLRTLIISRLGTFGNRKLPDRNYPLLHDGIAIPAEKQSFPVYRP
ncbi:MAG: hypothetical protein WC952_15135 [Desulfobulbaceae bacterium]|jgi:hypothetical protein